MASPKSAARAASQDLESAASEINSAVREEFEKFVSDLEDLVKSTGTLTGAEFEKVRQQISERLASARESLASAGSSVLDRAKQAAQTTDTYVHEEPWKSVGITAGVSAGIGFLLGILVGRR